MTGWVIYDAIAIGFGLGGGALARLLGWGGQAPVVRLPRRTASGKGE